MKTCSQCGHNNAEAKISCERCHSYLVGYDVNNMTGEWGYRNLDGTFTKTPKGKEDIKNELKEIIKYLYDEASDDGYYQLTTKEQENETIDNYTNKILELIKNI